MMGGTKMSSLIRNSVIACSIEGIVKDGSIMASPFMKIGYVQNLTRPVTETETCQLVRVEFPSRGL